MTKLSSGLWEYIPGLFFRNPKSRFCEESGFFVKFIHYASLHECLTHRKTGDE